MDQMLNIIQNADDKKKFSQEEIQQFGNYLLGRADVDSVRGLVPKTGNRLIYYYNTKSDVDQITDACQQDPTMLQRLGRFLVLAKLFGFYNNLIDMLLHNGLDKEQVFIDSGLGPVEMIAFYAQKDRSSLAHTNAALEYVIQKHPGAIEQYLRDNHDAWISDFRVRAWYCGRQDIDLFEAGDCSRLLGIRTLFFAAGAVKAMGGGAEKQFRRALAESTLPEAIDILDNRELNDELDKKGRNVCVVYGSHFVGALALSGYALPKFNKVYAIFCEVFYSHFMENLYDVCGILGWPVPEPSLENESREATGNNTIACITAKLQYMDKLCSKIGIDRAYLCAWAYYRQQYETEWVEVVKVIFGNDPELLARAASIAEDRAVAPIYRALCAHQEAPVEEAATACSRMLHSGGVAGGEAQAVRRWLLEGQGDVTSLPSLDLFFNFSGVYYCVPPKYELDLAIAALAGLHPITGRYLEYMAHNQRVPYLYHMIWYILENLKYTPGQTTDFLLEHIKAEDLILVMSQMENINNGKLDEKLLRQVFSACVATHPDAAAAVMPNGEATPRLLILRTLYETVPDYNEDFLIGTLHDKSKQVREMACGLIASRKHLVDQIRPLTEAKKKDVREAAQKLMIVFGETSVESDGDSADIVPFCTKNLPGNWKVSLKWAFQNPDQISVVRGSDGGATDPVLIHFYLYVVLSSKSIELPPAAARIRAYLNEDDLRSLAVSVYNQWLSIGAPAKYKAAVLFYAMHSGDGEIIALQKQLNEWAENSRGALASDAVRAMAYSKSDLALMTIDTIGRKFKNKQVRRAGQEAFASAAAALGISPEALGDRIVPALGFNARGEKEINYGTRKFTAILSTGLSITIKDESGKVIKSLPKPGAKDDAEIAGRAQKEFSDLKKSLKAVVGTQTQRLEQALGTGRTWTAESWEKLFVHNPIMHGFAINLVWGLYDGQDLSKSFRYMEDGTFADIEDEEFDFGSIGAGKIGLVHPLDLGEEATARWRELLEDYEIIQPFLQIDRKIFTITEEEKARWGMGRFAGRRLPVVTLLGRLTKSGWYRGSVQDGGGYYTFYKETGDIGVQLSFSGTYVGAGPEEIIVVGEACFYRAGTVEHGSYVYDDIKKETAYKLAEVSPRFFSELVLDLEIATAGAEYDENWKRECDMTYDFDKKSGR